MKKFNILFFLLCSSIVLLQAQNQRYLSQVFSEVTVTSNVRYGANATVLAFSQAGQAIQQPLLLDVYTPVGDTATQRPLVLVFHSGNFLPFPQNGGTSGTKEDSTVVEICKRLARRGFVAASVDYRLGWNPIAGTQTERIFTLINAAYRGVQDARTAIRFFKRSIKENNDPYGIDSTKITLWGVGTGGYISLNTVGLDSYSKVLIQKFTTIVGTQVVPMIVEPVNGNIEGTTVGIAQGGFPPGFPTGDTLNYPNHVGYTSNFQLAVNLGGALGDSSWLDQGQVPIISFQVPTDPFAPYNCGVLNVPPPINLPVVDVCGSNVVSIQQDKFGNNQVWENAQFNDAITQVANARNGGREGLFPFPTVDPTDSAPWDFYASTNINKPLGEEPDPVSARLYIDTIMAYFAPRACVALGLGCDLRGVSSAKEVISANDVQLQMMPNPAYDQVRIQTGTDFPIQDVQVFDLSGKMVKSAINLKDSNYTLHRGSLSKGMYIVKLRFEQGIVTQKLIFN